MTRRTAPGAGSPRLERLPWFNGGKLDDNIDYLTYVFVPALFVWRRSSFPIRGRLRDERHVAVERLRIHRDDAKDGGTFFTGFPSYWNIVVFYRWCCGCQTRSYGVILLALAVMVFVPLRYVYPSRTTVLRLPTNVMAAIWGVLIGVMLWRTRRSQHGASCVAGGPGLLLWPLARSSIQTAKAAKNRRDGRRRELIRSFLANFAFFPSFAVKVRDTGAPEHLPRSSTANVAADRRPRAS